MAYEDLDPAGKAVVDEATRRIRPKGLSGAGERARVGQQSLQTTQAAIDANPEIQALLQQHRQAGEGASLRMKGELVGKNGPMLQVALDRAGIKIPDGYNLELGSGQVREETGIPWWAFALPAVGVLGPMAINGAIGAGGAAGAGAGARGVLPSSQIPLVSRICGLFSFGRSAHAGPDGAEASGQLAKQAV